MTAASVFATFGATTNAASKSGAVPKCPDEYYNIAIKNWGDVDQNGEIDPADATIVLRYADAQAAQKKIFDQKYADYKKYREGDARRPEWKSVVRAKYFQLQVNGKFWVFNVENETFYVYGTKVNLDKDFDKVGVSSKMKYEKRMFTTNYKADPEGFANKILKFCCWCYIQDYSPATYMANYKKYGYQK